MCEKIADFFVLRNSDVQKEDVMNDLYCESGLLGSLSRIAKVAFYLGFINKQVQHDLLKLSRIRNKYAHDKHRLQLDDEPEFVKLLTDTFIYRQNMTDLEPLRPQAVFLSIQEQLSKFINEIHVRA
ncbi:MAG: MltR family transcriptional regulator [Methylomonas sp.]